MQDIQEVEVGVRRRLGDGRYLVRQGHLTIEGDAVSLTMNMPLGKVECGHTIGHIDNTPCDILVQFDKAVGGKESDRGWHSAKFPVWRFGRCPGTRALGYAMIARTHADCHGKIVDGAALMAAFDASPLSAATTDQPATPSMEQQLRRLDEYIGETTNFYAKYIAACDGIVADQKVPNDLLFSSTLEEWMGRALKSSGAPSAKVGRVGTMIRGNLSASDCINVCEMNPRFLANLIFMANVFVIEKTQGKAFYRFSDLAGLLSAEFAISRECASGILCRIIPKSKVLGVNACAFAKATELDTPCKFILDAELTLQEMLLGCHEVKAKAFANGKILAYGAQADKALLTMERRGALHIISIEKKGSAHMEDEGFKVVERPAELIVGWTCEKQGLEALYNLSPARVSSVALEASSILRAVRVLVHMCDISFPSSEPADMNRPSRGSNLARDMSELRTAMAVGFSELDRVKRVFKVLDSLLLIRWARVIRDLTSVLYEKRWTGEASTHTRRQTLFHIKLATGASCAEIVRGDKNTILFQSSDDVSTAAALRTAQCLGIDLPATLPTVDPNGRSNGVGNLSLSGPVNENVTRLFSQNTIMRTDRPSSLM